LGSPGKKTQLEAIIFYAEQVVSGGDNSHFL